MEYEGSPNYSALLPTATPTTATANLLVGTLRLVHLAAFPADLAYSYCSDDEEHHSYLFLGLEEINA